MAISRVKVEATSTDYAHPRRPLPVRLLNWIGCAGVPRRYFGELDAEQVVSNARAKSGLVDCGDEWFLQPLTRLIDAINAEAQLNALGRVIQRTRIEDLLAAHLRVQAYMQAHPDLEDTPLEPMIVIAGLQRTGTTTLHRLIASDPKMRALLAWEAMNPAPLSDDPDTDLALRRRQSKQAEKMLAYLSPEFFAVHPVEHEAPEEDVLILDQCFMSQSWEVLMNVPSFGKWLEAQDHRRAYEYLRQVLKLLLGFRAGKHWVLKTPHHSEYLDLVLKVFPQATIVLTHRDPLVSTTSFLSMVAHGRGVSSDLVDAHRVADQWVSKIERLMHRSIDVRRRADPERFVDVSYYSLLKDPFEEMRRIYARAGIPFTQEALQAAQSTARANPQHRYGRHRYDLASFGLDKASLDRRLGFYREEYKIPHE